MVSLEERYSYVAAIHGRIANHFNIGAFCELRFAVFDTINTPDYLSIKVSYWMQNDIYPIEVSYCIDEYIDRVLYYDLSVDTMSNGIIKQLCEQIEQRIKSVLSK